MYLIILILVYLQSTTIFLAGSSNLKETTAPGSPNISKKEEPADVTKQLNQSVSSSQVDKPADVPKDAHAVEEKSEEEKLRNVEEIFKEILPYGQNIPKNKPKKKKVSSVLTSEQWQAHHKKIKEEKENKQREIEERKRLREEKRREKEEVKMKKKAQMIEKKN